MARQNIFQRLHERMTGQRRYVRQPISFEMLERPTGHEEGIRAEFVLDFRLQVAYWCNSAQQSDARRVARRALAAELYADILLPLSRLEHALTDGDCERALDLCSDIRKAVEADE